jgi:hypothetical protein
MDVLHLFHITAGHALCAVIVHEQYNFSNHGNMVLSPAFLQGLSSIISQTWSWCMSYWSCFGCPLPRAVPVPGVL